MLKFEDFQYARPDMNEIKNEFKVFLEEFRNANSFEQQNEVIEKINAIGNDFSTQANLVYIRASIDTNDEFYQNEQDNFDEIEPEFQEMGTAYYKELISTPFKNNSRINGGHSYLHLRKTLLNLFRQRFCLFYNKKINWLI